MFKNNYVSLYLPLPIHEDYHIAQLERIVSLLEEYSLNITV